MFKKMRLWKAIDNTILKRRDKMSNLTNSLDNMFDQLIQAIPNIIYALLLLLLAWVIATVAKAIITKGLTKLGLHTAMSKLPIIRSPEQGKDILNTIGKIVYYLIFILFIPSILDVLGMQSVSQPVTNMMDKLLAFIPNLFAAAIILLIGLFVAKLVKEIVFKFLLSLGADNWFNRINPDSSTGEKSLSISSVLANVLYVFILIPILITALEALNISSISDPITTVFNNILNIIPNIFVAIILVTVGYYIAKILGGILQKSLQSTGINNIYGSLGIEDSKKPSFDLAKVITSVVKVFIMLFFTIEALNVLQLDVLNNIGNAILVYLPFLVSALIILGLGFFVANLLSQWIRKYANSPLSATIVKYIIIVFAVFMTLDQLQFAKTIVNTGFLLVLGGLMIAFAISFGIGGRDFAKEQLSKLSKKINKDDSDRPSL